MAVAEGEHVARLAGAFEQMDALLGGERGDQLQHVGDDLADQDRFGGQGEAARFDVRDVEHLVDEVQQMAAAFEDVADRIALVVVQVADLQQLTEAEHRVERRA